MTHLVAATFNSHKVAELSEMFKVWGITILSLEDYTAHVPEETGDTFEANALLKARYGFQFSGMPALADDSGLEVDALGGEPGIYSARYSGASAGDRANYLKLLDNLTGVKDRSARFRCVLALVGPGFELIAQGACEGEILTEPQGEGGFGYDPVFYLPEVGCSMAQLPAQEKNKISHRARALTNLMAILQKEGKLP